MSGPPHATALAPARKWPRLPAPRVVAERLRRAPGGVYLGVFFVALAAFLLSWPIFAADGDLWYHLAAGRQIAQTGSVPTTAVGSFLARSWIDYYWLFQLAVWAVHAAGGYLGLVVLRALLFAALVVLATMLVQPCRRPGAVWRVAALVAVLLVELPRFSSLRPHLVALVLLAACPLALERGGRWLYVLPAVALVWANVHGVSWPVMMLVLAAYGAELLWQWLRGRAPADLRARAVGIAVAAVAVLATPHGLALLRVPFLPLEFPSRMIDELAPLPPAAYFGLEVERLAPSRQTIFNVVALLAVAALLERIARRRLRLAHLLLVAGAAPASSARRRCWRCRCSLRGSRRGLGARRHGSCGGRRSASSVSCRSSSSCTCTTRGSIRSRSEEHTSELQ